jgi:hypothetical protein
LNISAGNQFGGLAIAFTFLFWLLAVVVHVSFAIGVWSDATTFQRAGSRLSLVGPAVWALATLFGGVFVAGVYWVIHHSSLRRADGGVKPPGGGDEGV